MKIFLAKAIMTWASFGFLLKLLQFNHHYSLLLHHHTEQFKTLLHEWIHIENVLPPLVFAEKKTDWAGKFSFYVRVFLSDFDIWFSFRLKTFVCKAYHNWLLCVPNAMYTKPIHMDRYILSMDLSLIRRFVLCCFSFLFFVFHLFVQNKQARAAVINYHLFNECDYEFCIMCQSYNFIFN